MKGRELHVGKYRISRLIMAPPEGVFRAFTDPVLVADRMDASGVVDASGALDAAGTTFRLVIRGPWRFRSQVVRSVPPRLHETRSAGPLGASYRMVTTLTERDKGTDLDLLTEHTIPLGPIGRWIDRRWVDRGPWTTANREVDRLVTLVSGPGPLAEQADGQPTGPVPER